MTSEEVKQLKPGLYLIHWGEDQLSVAAVGIDRKGNHWCAPTNWITVGGEFDWSRVESVELLTTQNQAIKHKAYTELIRDGMTRWWKAAMPSTPVPTSVQVTGIRGEFPIPKSDDPDVSLPIPGTPFYTATTKDAEEFIKEHDKSSSVPIIKPYTHTYNPIEGRSYTVTLIDDPVKSNPGPNPKPVELTPISVLQENQKKLDEARKKGNEAYAAERLAQGICDGHKDGHFENGKPTTFWCSMDAGHTGPHKSGCPDWFDGPKPDVIR